MDGPCTCGICIWSILFNSSDCKSNSVVVGGGFFTAREETSRVWVGAVDWSFPCRGPVVLGLSLVDTRSFSEVEGFFVSFKCLVRMTLATCSTSKAGGVEPSFVVDLVGMSAFEDPCGGFS